MKRSHFNSSSLAVLFTLAALVLVVGLVAGCSGSSGSFSTGKYEYQQAPAGQGALVEFKADGTFKVNVPAQQNAQDPSQSTEAQTVTGVYKASSDLVQLWKDKASMASSAPNNFLLIYKGTLVDNQGQVLVKQGKQTTSSAPSSTSSAPSSTSSAP